MPLTIAAAQSASLPGDIPVNVAHHLQIANKAADNGVQLLVFPELSLIGYELALAAANPVAPDSPLLDPLRHLAGRAHMTIVTGGPLANGPNQLHIAAFVIHPDGAVSTYSKEHVHSSEQPVFTSGPGGPALHIADATVALAICADASHPQHAAQAASRGANLYAAGVMIDEPAYQHKAALLQGYARAHNMAVLLANYSGATGGLESAGKSAIWSEAGEIVAASPDSAEALVIATKEDNRWSGLVVPL